MVREIIQNGNPLLRSTASIVELSDIASPKIQTLLAEMRAVLSKCPDGVALAAPQIGESLRIFVVSPRAYEGGEDLTEERMVYINPRITKLSSKKIKLDEGCLSVRNVYGKVMRSDRATIEAYDEHGNKFTRGAGGLLAEIFQHEVDHLDGKLFVDSAKDLRVVPPKEIPRIAFFGTPEFAVTIAMELERKELMPSLVVTTPDKKIGRDRTLTPPQMKLWADHRHIPYIQTDRLSEVKSELEGYDLFVVAAYGKIIPRSILDLSPNGALNVHPSLLPKHRGASPIHSTILEGDTETGVCIIKLDEQVDHGPILGTEKLALGDWKPTTPELAAKLAVMGGKLLARIIPKYLRGTIEPKVQDDTKATFTKKLETEDALIDEKDLETDMADRKVRALFPNPGAYTMKTTRSGKQVRLKLLPKGRVIPEGKKEMSFEDWKRGNL